MATVSRLNVTPMKGTALHHPSAIRVEGFGVPGNRRYYLVNAADERISATKLAPLMRVHVEESAAGGEATMTFPDGSSVADSTAPMGDPIVTDMWGRRVATHVVAGAFHEPLSSYLGEPVRMVRCDREGDGNDERAITLVSLASVAELARQGDHEGPLDAARFRMTIEIDGCEPHEEDTWGGRELSVGTARLKIAEPVPRCIVTTWDPETGERDFPTLKVIHDYRGRNEDGLPFGVYAEVVEPGDISVGDAV